MAIRILLVDDHPFIRKALRILLEDEVALQVVGEADGGEAAICLVEALRPDVVLMDVQMPGMSGVEATKEICLRFSETKVLVLTIDDGDDNVTQAMRCGAAGYLLKNTPPEELAIAILAVHKGYTHLGPGLGRKMVAKLPDPTVGTFPGWDKLTPREQEIVELISQGSNNREIALKLHISEKTVKNHITNILSRLDLGNRIQIAILANSKG